MELEGLLGYETIRVAFPSLLREGGTNRFPITSPEELDNSTFWSDSMEDEPNATIRSVELEGIKNILGGELPGEDGARLELSSTVAFCVLEMDVILPVGVPVSKFSIRLAKPFEL